MLDGNNLSVSRESRVGRGCTNYVLLDLCPDGMKVIGLNGVLGRLRMALVEAAGRVWQTEIGSAVGP